MMFNSSEDVTTLLGYVASVQSHARNTFKEPTWPLQRLRQGCKQGKVNGLDKAARRGGYYGTVVWPSIILSVSQSVSVSRGVGEDRRDEGVGGRSVGGVDGGGGV